jgi:pSer/pThr/pTyr-binding forkhead associated (FHA) protein
VATKPLEAQAQEETLTDLDEPKLSWPEARVPHLFVALECSRPEAGGSRHSLARIERVVLGRRAVRCAERSFQEGRATLTIGIPDRRASSEHALLEAERGEWFVEDRGSHNGTRLNGHRLAGRVQVRNEDLIEIGHSILRFQADVPTPIATPADADGFEHEPGWLLRTLHPGLAHRSGLLSRVVSSGSPILLLGETGTGKEVLARAIHEASGRRGGFVAVNCGALPAGLVEAQLLGHVRGAFSGASTDSPGFVRSADRGTLLLDEVGDLPAASQAAFLRVLQEREVIPVGGTRPTRVDVLILAATHRPLHELVAKGEFRPDLYARLAGFVFTIPPLRERREDIGLMIQAFAQRTPLRFTPAAGRALLTYSWPFNVRELHQTIAIAAAIAGSDPIDIAHLPAPIATAPEQRDVPSVDPLRERLVASLARHGGNISQVARELGKARAQVQRWIKRYHLDARLFQSR